MSEKDLSSYGKDLVQAVITTAVIAVVLAVAYAAFRAANWVGGSWG